MFSITGVSETKFPNFFYNLTPDFYICEVCELILLCAWAGFNRIPFALRSGPQDTEYIFVNLPSLPLLFEENEALRKFYQIPQTVQNTAYEIVMEDLFLKEREKKGEWVLQNVLFVEIRPSMRKDRDKPIFKYFHIGRDIARLFIDKVAIESIRRVYGSLFISNQTINLRREAVKRFVEGDQVYDLIYQVLRQNVDPGTRGNSNLPPLKSAFELSLLHSIRRVIWEGYRKGLRREAMESRQVYEILSKFYEMGASLGKEIDLERRLRMSYRLLSAVRSGRREEFYEMMMKLFIDMQKPIPQDLLSLLNPADPIEFESKAYALLSGFLGEEKEG